MIFSSSPLSARHWATHWGAEDGETGGVQPLEETPSHLRPHLYPPTWAYILYAPIKQVPIFYPPILKWENPPTCAPIFILPLMPPFLCSHKASPHFLSSHLRPDFYPPLFMLTYSNSPFSILPSWNGKYPPTSTPILHSPKKQHFPLASPFLILPRESAQMWNPLPQAPYFYAPTKGYQRHGAKGLFLNYLWFVLELALI